MFPATPEPRQDLYKKVVAGIHQRLQGVRRASPSDVLMASDKEVRKCEKNVADQKGITPLLAGDLRYLCNAC